MTTAYGTTAGYKAWADERGVSYAGITDGAIDDARLVASEFIDATYRGQFPGLRTDGRDQDREWPRSGAYDIEGYSIPSDEVPVEVLNATYEGAKRELATAGSLNPDIKAGGGVLKRVKAGSVEVEYDNDGSLTKTFQAIEQALGSLLVIRSRYSGVSVRA